VGSDLPPAVGPRMRSLLASVAGQPVIDLVDEVSLEALSGTLIAVGELTNIAALLESRHGAKAHLIRKKKSAGAAPHAEIIEEYKANCDVIVAGVGD
jgi:CMP-2-keto-3-deoxyoctulosonic acid synthetase